MRVLAAACPVHGVMAEWNDPGPENPPEKCWQLTRSRPARGQLAGRISKCGARLTFRWSSPAA